MNRLKEGEVEVGMKVRSDHFGTGVVTYLNAKDYPEDTGFKVNNSIGIVSIGSYCWKSMAVYLVEDCVSEEEEGIETQEEQKDTSCIKNGTEWTDKHYDFNYTLTKEDIEKGFVHLDVYTVAKVWKIGSKDDSGALWHTLKCIPRYGEKNDKKREIKAMYNQIKALARIEGVSLEE